MISEQIGGALGNERLPRENAPTTGHLDVPSALGSFGGVRARRVSSSASIQNCSACSIDAPGLRRPNGVAGTASIRT